MKVESVRVPSPHTGSCLASALRLAFGASFLFASAASMAAPFAYVPNQKSGSISVIDTSTDAVVRTLTAGDKLGKRLQAVDMDAKGGLLYIVDAEHDKLIALDPATDTIKQSVDIGKEAEGVRISPSGKTLAVCAEGQNKALLIDVKTFKVEARIATKGRNPEHCEFTPDEKLLLTSNEGSNDMDVIDLASRATTGVIATSGHPRGAAFSGGKVYVAQEAAGVVAGCC